jgi:toxin ParE1/3/4
MDKYKIEITEPAENDLRSIGLYIAKQLLEPDTAKKIVAKIAEAIVKLDELPLRNALVSDERLKLKGIRKIIVENYVVFYIVDEMNTVVTIIRILYNRRDWINIL